MLNVDSIERVVNHVLCQRVQIRLDSGETVPAIDVHHDTGVHLLFDKQALGEASAEIVCRNLPKVLVAGGVSSSANSAANDGPGPRL